MRRFFYGVFAAALLAGCATAEMQQLPAATRGLQNGGFDEPAPSEGVMGWAIRGDRYGRAEVVTKDAHSPPFAVELTAIGRGSSGEQSLMLYQVLDPAPYRGKKVEFGAQVWTRGGAVNLTLYTPERTANDFFDTLESGGYVARRAVVEVPAQASFLSFGLQIFGPAGARAIVDDVFVRVVGEQGAAAAAPVGAAAVATAQVRVSAGAPGRPLPDDVFGMHVEWAERGNGLVDQAGRLRREVVADLTRLRIPVFRFPGGIHADYYDWAEAARPQAQRRTARNVFSGRNEPQPFGSPELVELLRATGATALITANYGTGRAEDAGAWARWFRDAGVAPAYWEVGNEIYLADPDRDQPNGRRIHHPAAEYGRDVARYRDAIRAALPEARVGAILHVDDGAFALLPAANRGWSETVLSTLTGPIDFVSVHNGYAPVVIGDTERFDSADARARVYRALYAAPHQTHDNLQEVARLLDARPPTRGLPIAVTEYGPLFGVSAKRDYHAAYVDQSRTLAAAIYTASMLTTLLDHPRVFLATYTNPVHRWYGGLLTDTDDGLIRTPTFQAFEWYRTRLTGRLVPVQVTTPGFAAEAVGLVKARTNVPDLVAQASRGPAGDVSVLLVNRSLHRTLHTTVAVEGVSAVRKARCEVLTASGPEAVEGPTLTSTTRSERIAARPLPCTLSDDGVQLEMPPQSIVAVATGEPL